MSDGSYDLSYVLEYTSTDSCYVRFEDPSGVYAFQYYNNKTTRGSADAFSVGEGQTTSGIDAQLAAAGSITGRITHDGGDPWFVQVIASDADGHFVTQSFTGSTEGNASGSYQLSGLAPGTYTVLFNFDGQGPFYKGKWSAERADGVAVVAGETTAGIDDDFHSSLSAVTTAAVTEIGMATATCGGSATEPTDEDVGIYARGVCWSTASNPTTEDSVTADGSSSGSFVSSLTGLSPGTTYHVRAYCRQRLPGGGHEIYGANVSFTTLPSLDTTPPTTTASGADDLWHNAPVTVAFSAVDEPGGSGMSGGAAKTEYQLDAGAWTTGGSCTVPAPADHSGDGEHTVSYRSTDAAGNTEAAKSVTVRIDTTPPAGGFALAAGAATTTTASVSADSAVTDAHGPLEMRFSVDGTVSWSGWQAYAASRALTLPGGFGSKTVHAQYRDAAGNLLQLSDAIEVVPADTVAPTIQASGVSDGAWRRTAVAVTLTAADPGSGVASITYALDGVETTVLAASALVDVAALPNAAHVLTFHATDVAGNASGAQTLSFTIDTSGPVTAADATSGRRGRALSLRYKVVDTLSPTATAVRIVVRNAKGKTVKTFKPAACSTGAWYSVRWTPKAKGAYRYSVYATDLAGNAQRRVGSAKVVVR